MTAGRVSVVMAYGSALAGLLFLGCRLREPRGLSAPFLVPSVMFCFPFAGRAVGAGPRGCPYGAAAWAFSSFQLLFCLLSGIVFKVDGFTKATSMELESRVLDQTFASHMYLIL